MPPVPGLLPVALPPDAIEVARVIGAWGIQGWLRIQPHSASPEALFSARNWYLAPPERQRQRPAAGADWHEPLQALRRQARWHGDVVVAALQDVADRTCAEALKGARIFISRSEFPPLDEGEYYWADLLGLQVINRQGLALGHVVQLMETGPQQVLVLHQEAPDGAPKPIERLIPFVEAFVDTVDVPGGRIVVDWQPDY